MIKIIKTGVILCLLMFTSFINAQITVTGKVTDTTNEPIEFVNVVFLNIENNEIIKGTITDEKGNFTIKTDRKGEFNLQISFVGFENYIKSISSSINLENIILNSINELDEVVIAARKKIIEKKEDKIIFNVQNTTLNNGNDGIEVLKNAPIIWVNNANQVLIRQEPATVLVNGRKINLTGTDLSNYIKNIDSENIQRIEIQTNTSANIDGNVTGGIVNIILKKKPLGLNANVKSYYTLYNKELFDLYNGASLNYGSEKWNAYLLYNFTKNNGNGNFNSEFIIKENLQSQLTEGYFNNQKDNHNYRLGFVSELSKNQEFGLEFYGTNSNNTFNSNNNIIIKENDPIAKGDNSLKEFSKKYIYNTILNYNYKIDTLNGNIKIIVDYLKHNFNNIADNKSVYEFGNFIDNTEKNTTNSKTDIYSIQADLFKQFFKKFKTDVGTKYITTKRYNGLLSETLTNNTYISNDRTSEFDYIENILAGYISVGYNLNEKNYFKIGLRIENTDFTSIDKMNGDRNTHNYNSWFPSLYYSRELSNKNSISLSYSRRLRRPSFNTLNNRVNKINDFSFDIGNPNLNPEFINKYEISLNKKNNFFSIYLNNITDAINGVWRIENDIAIHQNLNYGTNKQYGFEYSLTSNLTKWWEVTGTGELFHKNFKNFNFNLNRTTTFFNLQNNIKINKNTSFTISGNYMSPFLSANYINAENFTANLTLKKSFLNNKLNVRFYYYDIFNSQRDRNNAEFIDSNFSFFQKRNTRSFTIWLQYSLITKNKSRNSRNNSNNDTKDRL
ncbi:MAG: outer membrane beta-barrel family protein [Lutibacter sp.]|nr:outer membrane beta-barrel family protein [Lutibacter sp.]